MAATTHLSESTDVTTFLGLKAQSLVSAVRQGISFDVYERLRAKLGVSTQEMAEVLSIPIRTLQRRKRAGRLTAEESDRLLRTARIAALALDVFEGDIERAVRWLTSPKTLLKGESPLAHLDTEPGTREVEDMLYAIEYTMPA